mmetsp:Transcript_64962/g.149055  ORF Transcript_64962/g.149055 Transcript_64962/m.149055 type:complete len:131 (+) Transcript_64962:165-557(+)
MSADLGKWQPTPGQFYTTKAGKRKVKMSAVLDRIHEVCHPVPYKGLGNYAVKQGESDRVTLVGPGLPENDEIAGLTRSEKRWPLMLGVRCRELVGEIGEEEVAEAAMAQESDLLEVLCGQDCKKRSRGEL